MRNDLYIFDAAAIGCFLIGAGFNDFSNIVYEILGIVSFFISIIAGIVGLTLKIKHYLSDGKLTDDEIKDIVNDATKLADEIKDKIDNTEENKDE